jgi:hypothetical protein
MHKRKLSYFLLVLLLFPGLKLYSQNRDDNLEEKLTISGYIQTQYQKFFVPDSIGSTRRDFAQFSGGNFVNDNTFERFMIRRGRINLSYKKDFTSSKISIDVSERGVGIKDVYIQSFIPGFEALSFTAGLFPRPFGIENEESSSYRYSPERSRVIQTILPNERDLGLKIKFQFPEDSNLSFFSLTGAIVNGNSSAVETNNYKDYIGRINFFTPKSVENFKASVGASYYNGKMLHIYEPVDTIASNTNTKYYIYYFGNLTDTAGITYKGFYIDTAKTFASGTRGIGVERIYYGIDGKIEFNSPFGKTEISAEYVWGTQPSAVNNINIEKDYVVYNEINSLSPTGPQLGVAWPLYDQPQPYNPTMVRPTNKYHSTMVRNFNGGYISVTQNILDTNHKLLVKYDWYDPNTAVAGKEIKLLYYDDDGNQAGNTFLSPADVKFSTIGIGWLWDINPSLRFTVYYENVTNENTGIVSFAGNIRLGQRPSPGFEKDIKDDCLTIRLQYKF